VKNTLHYNFYFIPTLFLTLLGIADTTYLTVAHYKNYTDISYSSFCAISPSINCDTVAQSSWSILLGMPIALWGLFGYLFYLSILFTVRRKTDFSFPFWAILQFIGLTFSLIAICLGYISATKIHSYCLLCIMSYAISFLLFLYPVIVRRRFDHKPFLSRINESSRLIICHPSVYSSIIVLIFCAVGVHFFLPHYWIQNNQIDLSRIETGITVDGHPWIGSNNPIITIEEFTDYQCFQCRKLHNHLRKLIEQFPEKIRVIHRNFPLDHRFNPILNGRPFHIGSGEMALLAIYACIERKFWPMNDELYRFMQSRDSKSLDLKLLSLKVDLSAEKLSAALHSSDFYDILMKDIKRGIELGITATPAYVIDGQVYIGSLPSHILNKLKNK